jgi:hypothetical protein
MTSERSSDQSPSKPGCRSVADRMRNYRRRRKRGLRYIQVQIGPADLDGLVAKRYLAPSDRDDIAAIKSAIDNLMHDWLIS